jgi:hypothetical protein
VVGFLYVAQLIYNRHKTVHICPTSAG